MKNGWNLFCAVEHTFTRIHFTTAMITAKYIFIIPAVLLLIFSSPVFSDEVEIGDLVLNKTLTRVGMEFYKAFSDRWSSPEKMGGIHIRVSEVPSARWGSIISVWAGEELCFRTRLSSRVRNMDEVSEQAVRQVMATLVARNIQRQQNGDNGDLVGDGL
jgi:curli production assembly/transport component CsgE